MPFFISQKEGSGYELKKSIDGNEEMVGKGIQNKKGVTPICRLLISIIKEIKICLMYQGYTSVQLEGSSGQTQ